MKHKATHEVLPYRCCAQGLLGPKEGAVLRVAEPGQPISKAPWRILLKEADKGFVQVRTNVSASGLQSAGEKFQPLTPLRAAVQQVGAMTRRPAPDELELAFINASAAASPLTKTAKFLRGLVPGQQGKK
jgi:hypothetical protein